MEQNPQGSGPISPSNNLVERAKNILTDPQKEWGVINGEPANPSGITVSYLLPLILLGVVAAFIGYGLVGVSVGYGYRIKSMEWGIQMAIAWGIRGIAGAYILAFIIDALAPNFGAEKNFGKSFQVAAYSTTAGLVGGIFLILPFLAFIALLAGLYGLYLLYTGLPVLKKNPEDKKMNYFLVVIGVSILVNIILYLIQNELFPLRSAYR